MMATLAGPRTYEDLCRQREDGKRYELIEGELILVAAPSLWHQRVLLRLALAFHEAVTVPGIGEVFPAPVDVRVSHRTVVQPDVVVVLADRARTMREALIDGAPSLVVEIASRSSRARDRGTKATLSARVGVPEYWLVDRTARTVIVHADPTGEAYRIVRREMALARSETVPELPVNLDALFADLPTPG